MEPESDHFCRQHTLSRPGSAMVHPFAELHAQGGGLLPVEAFSVHAAAAFTAMIDGEIVDCGNAAFMRLMGVISGSTPLNNGVNIAAAGVIGGVFEMEYIARCRKERT